MIWYGLANSICIVESSVCQLTLLTIRTDSTCPPLIIILFVYKSKEESMDLQVRNMKHLNAIHYYLLTWWPSAKSPSLSTSQGDFDVDFYSREVLMGMEGGEGDSISEDKLPVSEIRVRLGLCISR